MASTDSAIPNIGELLGPLLERLDPAHRPLFLALAERRAADRYRTWANATQDATQRDQLLACADREEEIAHQVESLNPDAEAIQRDIREKNPVLEDINRSIFGDRPLPQQFAIQAQGERLGAATWRSFARKHATPEEREVFLRCAELEEESAAVLESILSAGT